ncbi:DUF4381 domain-containing protein [Klebsiella sp. I138]|uniref:DUF4381 domain-containing protein n=1 Tax=Klebsiella sp. I138 TaxID=2755385 RepID=UPI003DA96930
MVEKGLTVPELATPALPPSVSWLPLPPGWWVLGTFLLLAFVIYLIFRVARWRRNRWRREALAALLCPHSVDGWTGLIQRILLVHQPRKLVSRHVTTDSLLQQVPLDSDLRQAISARYCQRNNQLDADQTSRLRQQLSHWLKVLPDV